MFDKETSLFLVFKSSLRNLILTNKKELFKNPEVTEVVIPSRYSLMLTALKIQLLKGNTKKSFIAILVLVS